MNHDNLILSGMAAAIGLGLWGAFTNSGIYYRIASLITALPMGLGWRWSGWKPYTGEGEGVTYAGGGGLAPVSYTGGWNSAVTYFGCLMLTFGLLAWLFFRGASVAGKDKEKWAA